MWGWAMVGSRPAPTGLGGVGGLVGGWLRPGVPMETAGFSMFLVLVPVQMGWERGVGNPMGEGQPAAPQLTPSIVLYAHAAPSPHAMIPPPNPQRDFLCDPRLHSAQLWALKRDFQLGKGQDRGKRVFGKKGPSDGGALGWGRGQSVHLCVPAYVYVHSLCWGRVWGKGRKEWQVYDPILQP